MWESLAKLSGDKVVESGQKVYLEAPAIDAEGEQLRYEWRQVFGPTVRLLNQYSNTPYFLAPETHGMTKIFFEVTVSDGLDLYTEEVMILVEGDGGTGRVSWMKDDPDSAGLSLAECFANVKKLKDQ